MARGLGKGVVSIKLTDAGSVEGVPSDHVLMSASLGVDGALTCAWATPLDQEALLRRDEVPNWASFAVTKADPPVALLVTVTSERGSESHVWHNIGLAFPSVVRLPASGDFLIVGTRCRVIKDVPEHNAARVSPSGEILHTGTLGDGIEHIVATREDDLWVGYFDEGVFGNYGWGDGGPPPVGASGIVRFSHDFGVEWRYPQDPGPPIADCYTLALDGDDVYACPYTDFPILRIRDDAVEHWDGLGVPARFMLVSGHRLALLGGYRTHWSEGVIVDLEAGRAKPLRLSGPKGVDLHEAFTICVVGDTIVALDGTRILKGALDL